MSYKLVKRCTIKISGTGGSLESRQRRTKEKFYERRRRTCAAANNAFIELMGSLGSSADAGIPAACAAASSAALFAAVVAEDVDPLEARGL